jgi:tetrahydromethanopterin S-methyltransferase subunit H
LVEVVGATDEAMMNQVDFVADVTDLPFMISSEVPSALIAGTKHVAEIGVQNRVIKTE